jgi:purine-binding chemotaxis protein CheW
MSAIVKQQRSLGSLLVEKEMLTRAQLDVALEEQRKSGGKLGKVLVRLGFVRERDILAVLEGIMAVLFSVAGQSFAVESLLVREIIRAKEALPLPQAPAWMEGLFHYRGKVLPLMNLRARFGLPKAVQDEKTRIIIFEEPSRQVGIQVDEVSAVVQVQRDQIEDVHQGHSGIPGLLVYGLVRIEGRVVTMLDFEALLEYAEAVQMKVLPGGERAGG